ncbi:hypothetical protein [Pseudactinotalea terrae]|uniref:hypothetical protein n=1 Tax=Pseudactinotalea terrae TaxID=1743262 RepID=UPI0012E2B248|nr:hypothetical protein [Pseudactinotalea terrae]
MTSTADRNRQPAGLSTGGQFATEPKTETGLSLAPAAKPGHLRLSRNGHVDATGLSEPAELEYATAVESLLRNRFRARAAVGGSVEHSDLITAEAVLVRGLAMRHDPDLFEETWHILGPKTNEAAGKLLRSSLAEIVAEHPVPPSLSPEQRSRAVHLFATQSTNEPMGSAAAEACQEVLAEFGVGDCGHFAATSLARELDAEREHAVRQRRPFGVQEMVGVVNRMRAEFQADPLA